MVQGKSYEHWSCGWHCIIPNGYDISVTASISNVTIHWASSIQQGLIRIPPVVGLVLAIGSLNN